MKVRESDSTAAEEALGKWPWYQPSRRPLGDAAATAPVSAEAAEATLSTEQNGASAHQDCTVETSLTLGSPHKIFPLTAF